MLRRVGVFALVALAAAACSRTNLDDLGADGGGSSGGGTCGGGSGAGVGGGAAGDPAACLADSTIPCSANAYGYECAVGANPQNYDSLACSTPTPSPDGCGNDFCCIQELSSGMSSATCSPDDTIVCPSESYGFQCVSGDVPSTYDDLLTCSASPAGSNGFQDDYCCTYAGGGGPSSGPGLPTGCTTESAIPCTGSGGPGYACPAGNNPQYHDGLVCSVPTSYAGEDDYCCFAGESEFSATTCAPDDTMSDVCPPGSYPFRCEAGDDPTMYDASFACAVEKPDADGVHDDYCCSY